MTFTILVILQRTAGFFARPETATWLRQSIKTKKLDTFIQIQLNQVNISKF